MSPPRATQRVRSDQPRSPECFRRGEFVTKLVTNSGTLWRIPAHERLLLLRVRVRGLHAGLPYASVACESAGWAIQGRVSAQYDPRRVGPSCQSNPAERDQAIRAPFAPDKLGPDLTTRPSRLRRSALGAVGLRVPRRLSSSQIDSSLSADIPADPGTTPSIPRNRQRGVSTAGSIQIVIGLEAAPLKSTFLKV